MTGLPGLPGAATLMAGVAVFLLLVFGIARAGWREGKAGALPLILMLLGVLFLAWKQGFMRADIWHTAIFFSCAMSLAVALPVFFPKLSESTGARMHWLVVIAVAVLALCVGNVDSQLVACWHDTNQTSVAVFAVQIRHHVE